MTTDAWRPFEQSRDEVERIDKERKDNTCNLHDDCAAADVAVREAKRTDRDGFPVTRATHCSDESCEECFGC